MTDTEIKAALAQTVEGLLLMSESDFPLKPFVWPAIDLPGGALTADSLRAHGKYTADAPIETRKADDFFADLTADDPGLDDEQRKAATRFASLQKQMTDLLTDLVVYRVGKIKIEVYIVGKAASGSWVGVSSKQVET